MLEGRPADSCFKSNFHPDGSKTNFDLFDLETDVSDWQQCSLQSKEGYSHGQGKYWLTKGRIFIGDIYLNKMNAGKLYEM